MPNAGFSFYSELFIGYPCRSGLRGRGLETKGFNQKRKKSGWEFHGHGELAGQARPWRRATVWPL